MRRIGWVGLTACAAALGIAGPAAAADRESRDRVVWVEGYDKSDPRVRVEALVDVPAGRGLRATGDKALDDQGARRAVLASASYATTGLRWDNAHVDQYYNPSNQPLAALSALQATHGTWTNAPGAFSMTYTGSTTRCPSLTKACRGRFDTFSDVGWARLSGNTLAVTWYSPSIDEADVAINTRYQWRLGCQPGGAGYDLQTVLLHENGHVAGLDHSSDTRAVMYPSYQGTRCQLAADDAAGIDSLY
jgi:hypothetical protein